jgi:pimeloyl-ACP methyl ester carboxylesterase
LSTVDIDQSPAWFTTALSITPEAAVVTVQGVQISYCAWGDRGGSGIVLVHGGAAHAHWWDHIGPMLAQHRRVVAIDLSGHGDSGRRNSYSLEVWAEEILAVAADAEISAPTVIGHSMGGLVTLRLASMFGSSIAGAVAIDSPVFDLAPEQVEAMQRRAFGPLRVYPSRVAAIARFRPVPEQAGLPYVINHVAANSIRPVEGGWTWKFDPRVFARPPTVSAELLTRLECRVALFRAEYGLVTSHLGDVMYDGLGRVAPVIEIPAAGHHVMLDQPLALVTGIRTLLSDWDHSLPAEHTP